jgi:ATP-dependent helicase/nuclease subunit A
MTSIVDASARTAATDPSASFCVSAPAGSGKTELLIQRYLGLLSKVQRPEQILAITFTRKAAAEMRERVISALLSARNGARSDSPHKKITLELAEQVLAVDAREGWHLDRDISRFNIKTIDSFCAGLTRQMPVLSQFGGQAEVVDDAAQLYAEAVLELYKLLELDHPLAADLSALMLHFDNNWERLKTLLVSMLARREQWRNYVGVHHTPEESGAYLVATVQSLVQDELRALAETLGSFQGDLLELLQFASANLAEKKPEGFPGITSSELPGWLSLRNLLLTRTGNWRKSISKRQGFPTGKGEPEQRKRQLKAILTELQQLEGLEERLAAVQTLPWIEEDSDSWRLVLHLSRLLPMLSAQLLLVFQRHGVVDHSQVAQSALLALGEDDAPTELALRLDYQIEHILVDEFQDTAINQYELLHKLTRGWGEYNAEHPLTPRTLMIVGDAMQSIYGFRGANVGLFLKAQREGFNGVELFPVSLQCNFRSDQGVVDWVNATFAEAFPKQNNIDKARVRYSPATAMRPVGCKMPVEIHAFQGEHARDQEVAYVCDQIGDRIRADGDTIAVLGRSRNQLQPIVRRLKQLNISCHAPDLDSLAESPVVADLLTLSKALANDADRLAWMALLRAPWCGLRLADLLLVANAGDESPFNSIWSEIQSATLHDALSEDGRERLAYILGPLRKAQDKRDRLGLRVWIEQTWVELGGPQCAQDVNGLKDAEHFLQLLERAEMEGLGFDADWLTLQLQKCYMSAGDPDSKVQLMTLHKAKGLEFDCVILPQLERVTGKDQREIMLWDEHNNAEGVRSFLLAADDHSAPEAPTLYNYLSAQRQKKTQLETTRLLYVGATRAIKHLLLTCSLKPDKKTGLPLAPSRRCLLHPIWPTFQQQMTVHDPIATLESSAVQRATQLTRLVRNDSRGLEAPAPVVTFSAEAPVISKAQDNYVERSIGTVVHQALEQLSLRATLPEAVSDQDRNRWRMALQREGLWGDVLEEAEQGVLNSIAHTLRAGGKGRWMLSSGHPQAQSEWALTTTETGGRIQKFIIDRCFIDRSTGERWIIDYKNSRPATEELLEDFLSRECANYQEQLRRYRDALRPRCTEPLRCALFFTTLGQLQPLPELDLPAVARTSVS